MRAFALTTALLLGCQGEIVSPRPVPVDPVTVGPGGFQVKHFVCDASAQPAEPPLRRLSKQQYVNTVRALISSTGLGAAEKDTVLAALEPALDRMPADLVVGPAADRHGGFSRLDQTIQQGFVDASYEVAIAAGAQLTASTARLGRLLGSCATDSSTSNDATCLDDFLRSFGARALRRPLTADDVSFYSAVAGPTPVDPAAVADVIGLLLTAPQLLYQVEEADPAASPAPLDAYALAARLSYHFWQTLPDDALTQAAASGALLTDDGYRAQVERLFSDARADGTLDEFFGQWFRLDELTPLDTRVGDPVYDAFAGTDAPTPSLHLDMQREVLDAARDTARTGGGLAELLGNRRFFARSDALAALYRQSAWDGTSTPPSFTEPERTGLLTRGAFLASGSANTRPVMKGLKIRNALMCNTLPPPPANAMAKPIELSPDFTTRETVEALTEQAGTACVGCHAPLLNPLGFATESFDALGRHRLTQRLFAADGTLRAEKPIDTSGHPLIAGVKLETHSAADVSKAMVDSGELQRCFARQYFRFTFARLEDDAVDGCALSALHEGALSGRPLSELFMEAAQRPEFKRRTF